MKPTLRLVRADNGCLHLRSAERDFVIDDPPSWASSFLAALDGQRSLAAVATQLREDGHGVTRAELDATLEQLHALALVDDARHDRVLSDRERERYDRQLRYFAERAGPGASAAGCQRRLTEARVAVLGLGALGGHAMLALAASGVGSIVAADGDHVELSNLNRQTLYTERDLGRAKADVAAERVAALNSSIAFHATRGWIRGPEDVAAAVEGADFVVDAVDSPPQEIERWVNDACFALSIPYIGMSHYPPWIRIGPTYVPGETGCYRCQEVRWRARDPLFDRTPAHTMPAALGTTATAVGGMVAMEAIHYLTGIAPPASLGCAVLIDMTTLLSERSPVVRQPGCRVCTGAETTRATPAQPLSGSMDARNRTSTS